MSKIFFGFALADSMFDGDCTIERRVLIEDEARDLIKKGVEVCLNPSHEATITAMRDRFGIDVLIPEKPPVVSVGDGEAMLVMGVRGLPRLTNRHEYNANEIKGATFSFTLYSVLKVRRCPHCGSDNCGYLFGVTTGCEPYK